MSEIPDSLRLDVRSYASVTSTMDVAARAAEAGAAEGLAIVAATQTEGRGRRGRAWSSPPGGGCYLSLVLRPPLDDRSPHLMSLLTLGAGVGVRDAIEDATGLDAQLKWPNDLVVGRRKLAGILAEGMGVGTAAQTVILGIGINVAAAPHPDEVAARATAIEAEIARAVDRARLVDETLRRVADVYLRLRRGHADDILRAWRAAAPSASGSTVEWDQGGAVRRGVTAGVDDQGALLVRTAAGVERLIAGEVRWL